MPVLSSRHETNSHGCSSWWRGVVDGDGGPAEAHRLGRGQQRLHQAPDGDRNEIRAGGRLGRGARRVRHPDRAADAGQRGRRTKRDGRPHRRVQSGYPPAEGSRGWPGPGDPRQQSGIAAARRGLCAQPQGAVPEPECHGARGRAHASRRSDTRSPPASGGRSHPEICRHRRGACAAHGHSEAARRRADVQA